MRATLRHSFVALFILLTSSDVSGAKADDAERLGQIRFEVSGDAVTKAHIIRGVKLLHHMMYVEADREFAAALVCDSTKNASGQVDPGLRRDDVFTALGGLHRRARLPAPHGAGAGHL